MVHFRRLGSIVAHALLISGSVATIGAQAAPQQPDEGRVNKGNWALANRFTTAALRAITYSQAVQPRFLGKSDSMWYNWRDHDGNRFYLFIPSSTGGTKKPLFDAAKLAQALTESRKKPFDATNLPFNTVTFLKDHKSFRFTVDSTRFEWSLLTETLKNLGRTPRTPAADEERDTNGRGGGGGAFGGRGDPRAFSPDSTAFVFARDHNLFIVDVGKPDTTKITTGGIEDYSFGAKDTTENRRQLDALGGGGGQDTTQNDGYVPIKGDMRVRPNVEWSPDSKSFALTRSDSRKVQELYLVNVLAEPRPVLLHYKYSMPGEENVPQQELWTYRRGEKQAKQLFVGKWKDQRLMDLHWPVGGDKVRMVRRDRPQRLDVPRCHIDLDEIKIALRSITTHHAHLVTAHRPMQIHQALILPLADEQLLRLLLAATIGPQLLLRHILFPGHAVLVVQQHRPRLGEHVHEIQVLHLPRIGARDRKRLRVG